VPGAEWQNQISAINRSIELPSIELPSIELPQSTQYNRELP